MKSIKLLKIILKSLPFLHRFIRKSYSLFGEDLSISALFGKQVGMYVDIGSGHPVWGSNTYLLYRKGWDGILVDPLPINIFLSRLIRRRDTAYCSGIGQKNETSFFWEFESYEFSTFDEEIALRNIEQGIKLKEKKKSNLVRFDCLPIINNINFSNPTFLNIDIEGFDAKVLQTINLKAYPFAVICIEEWSNPINKETEVFRYLKTNGYLLMGRLGTSSIYQLGTLVTGESDQ